MVLTVRLMSLPSTNGLCRAPRFPFHPHGHEIGAHDVKGGRFLKADSPGGHIMNVVYGSHWTVLSCGSPLDRSRDRSPSCWRFQADNTYKTSGDANPFVTTAPRACSVIGIPDFPICRLNSFVIDPRQCRQLRQLQWYGCCWMVQGAERALQHWNHHRSMHSHSRWESEKRLWSQLFGFPPRSAASALTHSAAIQRGLHEKEPPVPARHCTLSLHPDRRIRCGSRQRCVRPRGSRHFW